MAAKKKAAPQRKTVQGSESSAPKQRSAATPRRSRKSVKAGDEIVTIDRRRPRRPEEPAELAPAPTLERRQKVQRRRQIDPTTCERDYSIEEIEFMNAMDDYKRKSGRMFPTCSEVLEVVRSLGYVKLSPVGRAILAADQHQSESAALELEESLPRL